jgi:hypothetical protein
MCAPVFWDSWMIRADGGLYTGTANNLGDVVLHVGIAHAFVFGENIPPDNIIWAGRHLTYPFIPDFVAAALIVTGWSTRAALAFPALVVASGAFILLSSLAFRASRSLVAAALPVPILLFVGGAHFLPAVASGFRGEAMIWPNPVELETRGIVWKNVLLSMLVTQRATLFGLAIILAVALLVWRALEESDPPREKGSGEAMRSLLAAGALCGALPLIFPHGYLALAVVLPILALGRWRSLRVGWLSLAAIAAIPALPQVVWILSEPTHGFLRWLPGWLSAQGDDGVSLLGFVSFWLWNLGVFVPGAVCAVAFSSRWGLARRGFWASWWVWFALPSCVAFAPWAWDNTKLFLVWLALSTIPVSVVLADLLRRGGVRRVLGGVLLASVCAAGVADIAHALFEEDDYLEYTAGQRIVAERLRETTEPRALILERPAWAQLAFLAGRRSFMGYPGHLWSHGIDYAEREREIEGFYRGLASVGGDVGIEEFLRTRHIDYVIIGPAERAAYGADPERLAGALPRLFDLQGVSVFATRPRATPRGVVGRSR